MLSDSFDAERPTHGPRQEAEPRGLSKAPTMIAATRACLANVWARYSTRGQVK